MPLFGSHLSIAGGYHRAVRAAAQLGMDCVQIFTKNNNQWRAKPLSEAEVEEFRLALAETGVERPIAHDAYLINLGSPDPELWGRSIEALAVELERASALGIPHVVAHPGTHAGAGEEAGIARVTQALDRVFARTANLATSVALETTAGQGSSLGYRFEHLAGIIERCSVPERLTVCLDTCHVFAAGYSLWPRHRYRRTMAAFERLIGFDRLVAVHVNDSKRELGSRVDRHEHIGRGRLGLDPFSLLVNDRRLRHTPMYLETPKAVDPESNQPWDAINLHTLRSLVRRR